MGGLAKARVNTSPVIPTVAIVAGNGNLLFGGPSSWFLRDFVKSLADYLSFPGFGSPLLSDCPKLDLPQRAVDSRGDRHYRR